MIFRQLFDATTSTFTYLLADESSHKALLIDTVFEQHERDLALLRELELELMFTLETHVHADHVTGAWLMKQATHSQIALAAASGTACADVLLQAGDKMTVGSVSLEVRATPGHTDGCLSFVLADKSMVFTGDALLIRGAGRTDFQQGDPARLFRSVREQLFSLEDACFVYPGHDYAGRTVTTIGEERRFNPRLGEVVREQDFVGYMNHLGLPHPRQMAAAVPANLKCGKPELETAQPAWGPVVRTFAGVLQIDPEWVHAHRSELVLVDVRESGEFQAGGLPAISGALRVPLSELKILLETIPRERPLVTLCPAGARSAQAALVLEKAGFEKVANLRGGLLEWLNLGLPFG